MHIKSKYSKVQQWCNNNYDQTFEYHAWYDWYEAHELGWKCCTEWYLVENVKLGHKT